MQEVADIPLFDPAIGMIAAICACAALTLLILRSNRSTADEESPLSDLLEAPRLKQEARAVERRVAPHHPRGAVLRGRIDHLQQVHAIWGQDTRDEAIAEVASVMRRGLREHDMVIETGTPQGDPSFTVLARNADESEAGMIARRLLEQIAQAQVKGMSDGFGLTASFGVAARRLDESVDEWHARAGSALDAAQNQGEDQVLTATEWEEISLLPSPEQPVPNEGDTKVA